MNHYIKEVIDPVLHMTKFLIVKGEGYKEEVIYSSSKLDEAKMAYRIMFNTDPVFKREKQ